MKMNKNILGVLVFAVGAAMGTAGAVYFLRKKYDGIAQEKIDSVKELYQKKEKALEEQEKEKQEEAKEKATKAREKESLTKYASTLDENGYTNYAEKGKGKKKSGSAKKSSYPYVINPNVFGEINEYQTLSFTWYADGTLTDDEDEPMSKEAQENMVGSDFMHHFGEYEDDSVFVRNDKLKCDIEILMNQED